MTDKQILLSTSSHWLILLYTTYCNQSGQSGLEKSQKKENELPQGPLTNNGTLIPS